jgi:hypothetical protein
MKKTIEIHCPYCNNKHFVVVDSDSLASILPEKNGDSWSISSPVEPFSCSCGRMYNTQLVVNFDIGVADTFIVVEKIKRKLIKYR